MPCWSKHRPADPPLGCTSGASSEAIQPVRVRHIRFATGEANMLTDDGMLHLRNLGAFAAKESANTSRRVIRKME